MNEKRKMINTNVSFADATLSSFYFEDQCNLLNVFIKSWNEKTVKLNFENVLYFSYKPGDFIFEIYEVLNNPQIVIESLIREYSKIPDDHSYKLIRIDDIDDISIIEVVCNNLSICII